MSQEENLLREAYQKKGIGPKGSRKVDPNLIARVLPVLSNSEVNLNTRAAFWVTCLLLECSEEEEKILDPYILNPEEHLPLELQAFSKPSLYEGELQRFLVLINQVIQAKDLTASEAQEAMDYFWSATIPQWPKGAFLQVMRIKRESLVENFTFFNSMYDQSKRHEVDLPCLFDLCDSYDGTNRSYHLAPFMAPILAAMGYPAVVHGVLSMGPKYGITNHQLLKLNEKPTLLSLEEATQRLLNPDIGWCYIDQAAHFPDLFALEGLRRDILKRPFLSTFEKLLQPIRNKKGNIVITGYVHAPYRERLVNLMYTQGRCEMFFALRSIEGSTNCRLHKDTGVLGYRVKQGQPPTMDIHDIPERPDDEAQWLRDHGVIPIDTTLQPASFGIRPTQSELIRDITTERISDNALKALAGEQGLVFDLLTFHVGAFLALAGKVGSQREAAAQVREVLLSGKALQHWQAYQ